MDDDVDALADLVRELVEEEAPERFRRARVAREERALDHLGQVDEGEDGSVEVGEVRREDAPLLLREGLHSAQNLSAPRAQVKGTNAGTRGERSLAGPIDRFGARV